MEGAIFRFHKTKKDDLIMAATSFFGSIINIHPFEDGNGKICCLVLAHVLIQMKIALLRCSIALSIDVAGDTIFRQSKGTTKILQCSTP